MESEYARTIAARGITPEHKGRLIKHVDLEGIVAYGYIMYYEHFSESTVIGIKPEGDENGWLTYEIDVDHLDKVTIYDR